MQSRPPRFVFNTLAMVLALAAPLAAQNPKDPSPPSPETHSKEMARLLDDPATKVDSGSDRLLSDLDAVNRSLNVSRAHVGKLRAALTMKPSQATEAELVAYNDVIQALSDIRLSLTIIQKNISDCTSLCAAAELAAAGGGESPADHHTKMMGYVSASQAASAKLTKEVNALRELAAKLPRDPALPKLVKLLEEETKATDRILASCNAAMGGAMTGDADARADAATYICPMHPEVILQEAGECPKCGMKLVPSQK